VGLSSQWDDDRATWINTDEFASAGETFTYADGSKTLTISVTPVEMMYSIFDPIQNVNFYVNGADFDGEVAPQPGDLLTYLGDTLAILNIKFEHGIYLFSGIRQELRQ